MRAQQTETAALEVRLVLIIDDDELVRAALTRTLRKLGYAAISAGSGEEGIQKAVTEGPTAILCDMRMPGLDGLGVLRRLSGLGTPVPFIVMSGQDDVDDPKPPEPGVLAYLRKPWSASELAATLDRALQTRRQAGPPPK